MGAIEELFSYVSGGLSGNDVAMDALDRAEAEVADLRARIARYEAPSPVLLSVADASRIGLSRAAEDDPTTGRFLSAVDAAMEQHARCHSVHESVARLLWPLAKRSIDISGYSGSSGDWPLQDAVSNLRKAMLDKGMLEILIRLTGVEKEEVKKALDLEEFPSKKGQQK